MGLFKRTKNNNKPLFRQVLDLIPDWILQGSINKYHSDKECHKYRTYDQLVALIFGQLCKCSTLADISTGLSVSKTFISDGTGFEQQVLKKDTIIVEDRGYFDFSLMLARIKADNVFVTRIKNNATYRIVKELDLPDDKDHHILKDEIIVLNGTKAIALNMHKHQLRRTVVYDEKNDRILEIISNQITWSAATIGALYNKKRWDIESFFKVLKQNLQVKTFIGTSKNAVKSQIYVALITFLLVELLRRNTCETQ